MNTRLRRVLVALIVVDLIVVAALAALWVRGVGSGHSTGFRGSTPAPGQQLPVRELVAARGFLPSLRTEQLTGRPVVVVATCLPCRSGDVLGGFLGRFGADDIPADVHLQVIGVGGDATAWRREWSIPARWNITVASDTTSGMRNLRKYFRTGDSGQIQLYDDHGEWRTTWHLGQIDREDLRHDIRMLVRG